jgi:hypothetical protein
MYYKYPQLIGICNTCAGCNLLEDVNFKGKQQCKNHLRLISPKVQDAIKQIHKNLGIEGEQIKI